MSEDNMKDTELEQAAAEETSTPAETSSAPKKAAKPKRRKSTPASHPPCIDMITEAINNLGEKNGSSFQAIKKYIATNFDCDMSANLMSHVRKALKSGVASGKLVQTKGKGASGSFKMGNVAPTLMSKPTKRQIASAEAAARNAAKAQKAAKKAAKAAKRPKKKKKPVVQKAAAAARRPTVKKSVKKPAAKKAAKSKKAAKKGRKGKK